MPRGQGAPGGGGGFVCLEVSRCRGVNAFPGGPKAHLGAQSDADAVAAHGVGAAQLQDLHEETGDGRTAFYGHFFEFPRLRHGREGG